MSRSTGEHQRQLAIALVRSVEAACCRDRVVVLVVVELGCVPFERSGSELQRGVTVPTALFGLFRPLRPTD